MRGRLPAQQLRNRSDQIGAQHARLLQTMLKPPLMLSTCPVIQPECGDANSVTIGAMSPGKPRRRARICRSSSSPVTPTLPASGATGARTG